MEMDESNSFVDRVTPLSPPERRRVAAELVAAATAAVLRQIAPDQPPVVELEQPFRDLGLDSLGLVALQAELGRSSGLTLPPTVGFDFPTPARLAAHLLALAVDGEDDAPAGPAGPAFSEEPIAIVGVGCRYPGGVHSPEQLGDLVADGRHVLGDFPADRGWDLDALYDPDPDRPGSMYVRHGGFLTDAADFDAAFFGISPREAQAMDPQQRLVLETVWEAVERTGIDAATLRGSRTGVFLGAEAQEYGPRLHEAAEGLDGYLMTGNAPSVVSGRVAYALGLQGPALTVDTACSSSLVALHLAVQSLRRGESELAFAGGVAVMAGPGTFTSFSRQRGLAPDGLCKPFAAAADGTGFAEGAGVLVLERLSDAQRLGHPVLAVVRGSAVNSDGASNGLTAPNGPAQRQVIRQALADAGLTAGDVDVVEAHGTGTTLGDPIEAQAVIATYGAGHSAAEPLLLGSIKSNIGHTQAAAGAAGIIKMIEAMRREVLPATLHVDRPSPHVDWSAGTVALATEPRPWPAGERPRRAAVSSFGVSGTNAHVIIEEPPAASTEPASAPPPADGLPVPLVVTARDDVALRAQAERLLTHLDTTPVALNDLGLSLGVTRTKLDRRAVVLATGLDQARQALRALAEGARTSAVREGSLPAGRLAFLFTGQGSQRLDMGRELSRTFPVFREALADAIAALDVHLEVSLWDVLFGTGSALLDHTEYTQAALFAVETALYRLVTSWGVTPDHVAGHSVGELTAAHVAGVLDLDDAALLVTSRGRLMGALPPGGVMTAVAAAEADVLPLLTGGVDVAAVNGPRAVVLSGVASEVDAVVAALGVKATRLNTSHAFHSRLMEPMLAEFAEIAEVLDYHEPQLPVISNVTGRPATGAELRDPAYWVRHVRACVRFSDGIAALAAEGVTTFLELGPDAVLSGMGARSVTDEEIVFVPALRRDRSEAAELVAALATVHARGAGVDWAAYFAGRGARRISLPTYAFQRRSYWLHAPAASDAAGLGQTAAGHPLLGAVVRLPGGSVVLTGRVSARTTPWLADHVVGGAVLVPGTALVELAVRAGDEAGTPRLAELTLHSPLVLTAGGAADVQVVVGEPDTSGARTVEIHSRTAESPEEPWLLHASGSLDDSVSPAASPAAWPPADAEVVDVSDLYETLDAAGYGYGPSFRGLRAVWRRGREAFAEVALPDGVAADTFGLHPALFDAVLHATDFATGQPLSGDTRLPFAWTDVALHATGATTVRAHIVAGAGDAVAITLTDPTGATVATVGSFVSRTVAATTRPGAALYEVAWAPIPTPAATTTGPIHAGFDTLREALTAGTPAAPWVAVVADPAGGDVPAATRDRTGALLDLLTAWLADPGTGRLVVVTRHAVAARPGEAPDVTAAALGGLVRTAQAEHPGRFQLVDLGDGDAALLAAAVATGEPELAVRDGQLLVARLAPAEPAPGDHSPWAGSGTVLITGGTGGLGGLAARHLVAQHGVRRLVLTSRRGPDAPGAAELVAELRAAGAEATVAACDVADRRAVAALLETMPDLTGVVHTAGAVADGLIGTLDRTALNTVLAAKADGAWHLHELTAGRPLTAFVLYSSAAGTLDGAGQGNYAAANAFLDALAARRRAGGLAATALAWGLWTGEAGMGSKLSQTDVRRAERSGLTPLSPAENLALFDTALAGDHIAVLPLRLDRQALRGRGDDLPAMLRGLVRPARRAAATTTAADPQGTLAHRLAQMPPADRPDVLLDLVRAHVAAVLGFDDPAAVDPKRAFQQIGFDSLASVELRNRLTTATGLRLPATLTFDYPTVRALAEHLGELALPAAAPVTAAPITAAATDEPIAIVGLACRYPGGVASPEDLWRLVAGGEDGITEFPGNRGWDVDGLYDPEPGRPGKTYSKEGGFLHEAAEFDPAFFGISPREAQAMDPQQRLLLEVSWEAFERAGIDPHALRGSRTGVFAGVMYHDWATRLGDVPEDVAGYLGNGSLASVVSGRVAYVLGLEGPAVTVDTACSSSLVALHWAIQAVRQGECSLALAGGVTVMSTPDTFTDFSRQRGLAADGRCKSFADAADGTGWGEGAGMLLVERLSDAIANGHPVRAVIRGSAINQDGASNGLTAPNGPAQQRVIRAALASGGLGTGAVDVVEAHGTGTTLGDPIEAQALLATYGQDRSTPLLLGSIKSNIGHTQAAAGVAGIIKMVEAMRHGVVPRTLHVDEPSTKVDWEAGQVSLVRDPVPWPAVDRPRRAGVSSFGISGTNAHVIIEQAPAAAPVAASTGGPAAGMLPWVLSGHTPEALRGQADRLLGHLAGAEGEPDLAAAARTLAFGRAQLEHRAAVVASGADEMISGLAGVAAGTGVTGVVADGKLAVLFTGQGSQRAGMGDELAARFPVFAEAFAAAKVDVIGDIDQTGVAQPSIFAFEVALYRLIESWGVKPDYLAGHSIGEIAAAHVAGVLSLDDAKTLVAARARLMQALPAGGVMVAVAAPEGVVRPLLTGGVDIAAVNGPASVVLSGAEEAVQAVVDALDVKATRLKTSHAFHSYLMEPMLADFAAAIGGLTFHQPAIPVVATGDMTSSSYWVQHVRDTVRFADNVGTLLDQGVTTFLEVGPDAILTGLGRQISDDATFIALQHRSQAEEHTLVTGVATAWTRGVEVDWKPLVGDGDRSDLPTYAFQRRTYWLDAVESGAGGVRSAGLAAADHPLLGAVVAAADGGGLTLTGRIAAGTQRWTADHVVLGRAILPGTGFVELALRAGEETGCELLEELTLEAPLTLPARGGVAVQVGVGAPGPAGRRAFTVHTRPDDTGDAPWTRHAVGFLAPAGAEPVDALTEWPPPGATALPVEGAYRRLAERGYHYGPVFQGLRAAWRQGDELFAEVELPEQAHADAARYGIHPALLDTAMHADLLQTDADDTDDTLLPFAWTGVRLHAAGAAHLRVRVRRIRGAEVSSMLVADGAGRPVLSVERLVSRAVTADRINATAATTDGLFTVEWQPVTAPAGTSAYAVAAVRASGALTVPARVHAAVGEALRVLQERLAGDHAEPLVVVTRGAAGMPDEDPDVVSAPVWGLVRAAQAENPGRFVLLDSDDDVSDDVLARAVATGEPELAVRDGRLLAPRLVAAAGGEAVQWSADDTILVTGGTGGIGARLAEHLAGLGAGRLVLTSRRGPQAPGADELAERLTAAGAVVHIEACDVTDRDAVGALVERYADTLTAVIHAAGVSDNALIGDLTAERVGAVLTPKVDAGWHLHELTARLPLKAFVLFSSAGGLVLAAGQGNYAAANVFLDALARHRRARHLPATAIAYGLWAADTGLGGPVTDADLDRMRRLGTPAIETADALALFDRALGTDTPLAVALPVDRAALAARGDELPALLRGLVRVRARRNAAGAGAAPGGGNALAQRLAGLAGAERDRLVLELVRGSVATVLGHASAEAVPPERAFKELGFDSLAAVELRNALNTATGLRLPATLVFDHPSAAAVARYVLDTLGDTAEPASPAPVPVAATTGDPIVIVGMTCRYPGGITSPEELWRLVADGADAVGAFPADRGWDVAGVYDPEPGRPGKTYSKDGSFLYDAAGFDPAFFGISPREALAMDPQQRLLLESAWETFERAGIDPVSVRGSQTGVYVGVMYHDYGSWLREVPDDMAGYVGNGNAGSILSGRVSYALGLEGPAVSVDTACSSSLVALHMAVQALRSGEVTMALAGGVTVMSTPEIFVEFSQQRGLAPDGRCKSFAGSADGTGWGEGVGLLLLERLSDAERNGHDILAVVRGSAINQDGASNGLTAPNGPAQQRVIRQALAGAGLTAADVDVVEAHGTGTTLGDPIEAQALLATYGQDRDIPLLLGSIKSNIGHTQAAAGVAGIIKVVEAMRHGVVPRTLHVDEPSPMVDWEAGAVDLVTDTVDWPVVDRPRRAAVSSFGLSGTNAHVIVEQAPLAVVSAPEVTPAGLVPVAMSARSRPALEAQTARFTAAPGALLDVAYSSFTTRAALEHRRIVLAGSAEDLHAGEGVTGTVTPGALAVLFTGQGSQRAGMGDDLAARFPVFAEAFAAAKVDVIGDIDQTGVAQPSIFAFEVALYRLIESWGIKPDYVAGHSIGEIAAAHVAGVLSLEDAKTLVSARARLMQALPTGGVMVAVAASEEAVRAQLLDGVDIAAVNGPASVVLSGAEDAVQAVVDVLGVKSTRLRTSHAFHSHLMEPMLDEFAAAISGLTFHQPAIPVVATGDMTSPSYWVRHVRDTVRFADNVTTLLGRGVVTFLEVGPDAILTGLGRQISDDATFIALQHRSQAEEHTLVTGVATAWTRGVEVDWKPLLAGGRKIDLPPYAFQHERFWLDAVEPAADAAAMGLTRPGHPLLGAVVSVPGADTTVFTGRLTAGAQDWLPEHAVHGSTILPGTAFVELALHAGLHLGTPQLAELVQEAPLPIPARDGRTLQVVVGPADHGGYRPVAVHTRPEDAGADEPWTRHAHGFLAPGAADEPADLTAWPPAGAEPVDVSGLYDELETAGYGYGPVFRGLRAAWRRGDEVYAEVALPEDRRTDAGRYGIHPALLDATMHALSYGGTGDGADQGTTMLPFSWAGVSLHADGAAEVRVRLAPAGPGAVTLDVTDVFGGPVATVRSLTLRPVTPDQLGAGAAVAGSLFTVDWLDAGPAAADAGRIVRIENPDDLDGAAGVATVVAAVHSPTGTGTVTGAKATAAAALELVQRFLARPDLAGARLVVLTRDAAGVPGFDVDPAAAGVWGLLRAAQAENPGRFVLLDTDDVVGDDLLARAVGSGEPELAVRDGKLLTPRLVAATPEQPVEWTAGDTVLVTGGTGGLGALIAEHLVRQGAGGVVLTSRRGPDAPGAADLAVRLEAAGARVRIAACDVTDRDALAGLLDGVTAVVHAAGVADNALTADLTADRLHAVMAPKVDAGWHLHELTRDRALKAFVVLSSAGGLVLAAGQGNYAAANVFLDALAHHRRHHGLAATSLAYGLWTVSTGLGGDITEADLERMRRLGTPAVPVADGLALFDAGLATGRANLVPMHVDRVALGARADDLPALLRGLARRPRAAVKRAAAAGGTASLAERLGKLAGPDREELVLQLARTHVATVLGHAGADGVDADRPFRDLGFDSLTAIELRNALNNATGLRLPATLIFDHPTPRAVAAHLLAELAPAEAAPAASLLDDLTRLEAALESAPPSEGEQAQLAARLRSLAARLSGGAGDDAADELTDASAAELFDILDAELGSLK
ncbi:SDR family NAD(P)-dependent oxidoreductase [Paractinoplanes abujensis]|uniref:SDR family NAD(P)-dependent oxidoreductase n=1 Tax=Paractinoplanes abujensis TaxID=882441 RepID=UPI003F693A38